MKKRVKVLLMAGVLSLSAVGTVQLTYAEESEQQSDVAVTNDEANAGESNSGNADTGSSDTGNSGSDTGSSDAGNGGADAGSSDAGNGGSDSGSSDAGNGGSDSGSSDAGDGGSDTGSSDTGNDGSDTENGNTGNGNTGNDTQEPETPAETEIKETESETNSEATSESEKETEKKEKETEKIDEEAAKLYEETTGESIYVFGSYPVGDITENTNEIYDYLRNVLGLNHAAACGVLANIQCESNFASSAVGDGGTSYGLCQWHLGRFSALINWCNANGYEYHSIQGQLGYLTTELQGGYASVYQYLLSVPDTAQGAYDAAYYWCKYFEIPANLEYNSQMRADLAMNLYYPKTLGTQKEEETEAEVKTLDEAQMEQVLVAAPESISKLARLDISKEDTLDQALLSEESINNTVSDKEELKKEAEKAVEQALKEYQDNVAAKSLQEDTEQDLTEAVSVISPEELALFSNIIVEK